MSINPPTIRSGRTGKCKGCKRGQLTEFSRAEVYEVLRAAIILLEGGHGPVPPVVVDVWAGVVNGDDARLDGCVGRSR